MPTHDTRALLALIPELLPRIWRDEQRYMKGGVMLADLPQPACTRAVR
ncbi:hypothetical protein ACF2JD_21835 [Aeromonas sp. A-5]